MGWGSQTLNRQIEGTNGMNLEIKGFSYKKITSTLNMNISNNESLYGKGLVYTITVKGSSTHPLNQLLYRSELNSPLKNVRNINFKLCSIPDIYLSQAGNYEKNIVNIDIFDAKYNKILGVYAGPLKPLLNNNTTAR